MQTVAPKASRTGTVQTSACRKSITKPRYAAKIWRRFNPSRKPSVDVQKRLRKRMSQWQGLWPEPCLTSRGGFRLRPKGLSSLAPHVPCRRVFSMLTSASTGLAGWPGGWLGGLYTYMSIGRLPYRVFVRRPSRWSGHEAHMSRYTATVVRGARAICQARSSADRPESVAPNRTTATEEGAGTPVANGAICNILQDRY